MNGGDKVGSGKNGRETQDKYPKGDPDNSSRVAVRAVRSVEGPSGIEAVVG